jgi:5-methylcytosine-specific restriction endonuclease McrA
MKYENQYRIYLKSQDWRDKRHAKLLRTRRCGICGSTDRLDVHHLNDRDLVDVALTDLRVLCHRCHFLAHDLYRAGKIKFRNDNHLSRWQLLKCAVKQELGIFRVPMHQLDKS